MEIFEKRGRWCFVDEAGKTHKFGTEEEAKIAAGWVPPVEEECCEDCECDPCECEEDE